MAVTTVNAAENANAKESAKKEKGEETVTLAEVPTAVHATIDKEIPGASIGKIEKEDHDGKTVYDVEAKFKGKNVEMDIAVDGKLLTREDSVPFDSLPGVVGAAAGKYFGATKDLEAGKEVEDGTTFYEVEGKKDGKKVTLKFAADGKLVEEEKHDAKD
jgi:uncharacterized membrane protein YkoI